MSAHAIFKPAPEPKTPLGYRRILSPNAGIRVSPLCLGGMSLGSKWADFVGKISKEEAFALLDAFWEAGGNFIDTANIYHFGESEEWIGEWMEKRGNRDRIVLATKFSGYNDGEIKDPNSSGNHTKSLDLTVRESCRRLRTDYIDIMYLHVWEYTTSTEEIMRGLNKHIMSGKVIYPAISDTPAWVVVKANAYARAHGMSPFVLYQGRWNVSFRDMEREIIPMCRSEGMADLLCTAAIGQGKFMSKAQIEAREKAGEKLRGERSEDDIKISEALEKVAGEVGNGATVTAVALAWTMQKSAYVFPIVGGRKIEHLHDNIKALSIHLSDDQIKELEGVVPFNPGFPLSMIQVDPHWQPHGGNNITSTTAKFQFVQEMVPIKPQ